MRHYASPHFLTCISKLPFEILVTIFQLGVEEEFNNSMSEPLVSSHRQIPFARRVSQVCRTWREISRSISKLWATMGYFESYSARWVKESFRRSRNSPLDVKLSAGWRSSSSPPSNISALDNQLHRIRTLYGFTHSSIPNPDFQKLLEGPMPNLRTLVLSYDSSAWNTGNNCAFFTEPWTSFPSLTTFVSFRCSVHLSSPAFSQLQTLEIHGIPPRSSLTILGWLRSLRNMPSLQRLSITQSISVDPSEAMLDVEMPRLRVLRFSGDFSIFKLLAQLQTPCLEQLDLSLICGRTLNVLVPEETVKSGLRRSLHDWVPRLAEYTLGLRLTRDRLVIQTLSSPRFRPTQKRIHLLVELKWVLSGTTSHDVGVIVDSIGDSFQPIQSLATHIVIPTFMDSGSAVYPNPIPSYLSTPLCRLFDHLSHIRHWIGYSIEDVYTISPLLLGDSSRPGSNTSVIFPLLDTFSLRIGFPAQQTKWIKAFINGRSRLGRPIQILRMLEEDKFNLGDDLECRFEKDDQSLNLVFIEQDEVKHVSAEVGRPYQA